FNSCAVTSRAEADLRAGVRRAARANPRLRTVVMGCAAALDQRREAAADAGADEGGGNAGGRSLRVLPTVQSVVGGADLEGVARAFGLDPALAHTRSARQGGARALLRIQDGCDEHCTFCATTLA